ncbi:hypothetical protein AN478_08840 [Thiohalorhabdus denitrificans]|uniref:Methylated-DNA-[protein]-cysteine S-methyltransferase n=1 Tax=Thiohalorhabdus denitrificans TaxID=381306 RepID=A0A0P9C5W7_9GAMM|nr:methylated-DNA--[protein]-cysteine S-methyltransferase [Thiohalorhabdus denitrificans]KPV40220.1 hypothetical protein AN478_08840 [Thiohalorhabdus denitrificans]SCX84093.1 methylated-DNA-[protein]-cysteine S-methyltransferase [Thiohalorhabdus denitrificans]
MKTPSGPETELILPTPVGSLAIHGEGRGITRIRWLPEGPTAKPSAAGTPLILDRARASLEAYLRDPGTLPTGVPLAPVPATRFQRRVWRYMRAISPGHPLTYGQLAAYLGSSPRAVGNAAAANPWPLLVPCHRVVGRAGPGGYLGEAVGAGPRIKRWLLEQEGWRADGV